MIQQQAARLGYFQVRNQEHRDAIAAACPHVVWTHLEVGGDIGHAISDQFDEIEIGQRIPYYEWEIRDGRAIATRALG
jgi:hypothetical protein